MSSAIRTIILTGDDSINFANSIYRPTKSELLENKKRLDFLDETIDIMPEEDGFVANVPDLDLSFLDDLMETSNSLSFDITVDVNPCSLNYSNNKDDVNDQSMYSVNIQSNIDYCDSSNTELLMIAA